VTTCATTFFGVIAGDTLFSAFQRHSSSHFSSFFHLSHLSFELADSTFFGIIWIFLSPYLSSYQQLLLSSFLVWVVTPFYFFYFSQTRSLPHINLFVAFWILELDSLFKWRLHFFHLLIFLSRDLFLSSIWSLVIHHGSFV